MSRSVIQLKTSTFSTYVVAWWWTVCPAIVDNVELSTGNSRYMILLKLLIRINSQPIKDNWWTKYFTYKTYCSCCCMNLMQLISFFSVFSLLTLERMSVQEDNDVRAGRRILADPISYNKWRMALLHQQFTAPIVTVSFTLSTGWLKKTLMLHFRS